MEMRKTSVWISRSLGLLFVFSSFGHLIPVMGAADYSVPRDEVAKPSEPTESLISEKDSIAWWQNPENILLGVAVVVSLAGFFGSWRPCLDSDEFGLDSDKFGLDARKNAAILTARALKESLK